MTAPNKELFANNASSTLDGSIDDSQTSIDVIDGSVFPATGNFRLIVESELMLCTGVSGDTLTVERGAEGSTPDSHASGETIAQIITVGGLAATLKDNDALAGSDRPALGKIVADDGLTILTSSDFTDLNMSNGTKTDQGGTILLRQGSIASGEELVGMYVSAPSAPHVRIAAFQMNAVMNSGNGSASFIGCLFIRDSGNGKFVGLGIHKNGNGNPEVLVGRWNSATSYSADIFGSTSYFQHSETIWLKIEDDNTDFKFSVSSDGFNWIELATQGRTAFLTTPGQVGWGSRKANANPRQSLLRLCHWSKG
jgi:hypothetical protein